MDFRTRDLRATNHPGYLGDWINATKPRVIDIAQIKANSTMVSDKTGILEGRPISYNDINVRADSPGPYGRTDVRIIKGYPKGMSVQSVNDGNIPREPAIRS